MDLRIFPPDEIIEATVALPRSKSVSARALIMSALTPGSPLPSPVSECDDTRVMEAALAECAGNSLINVDAAGTAMRFLTAYYASQPGREVTIDGCERMRHRPIGPLVDALRAAGGCVEYAGEEGYPPLRIKGTRLRGGRITVASDMSSQFVSALLMAAPTAEKGMELVLEGETVSRPYVDMTVAMMRRRGVEVSTAPGVISVAPGPYSPCDEPIEADWTAASYWYEIAALSAGWIDLEGLSPDSIQGDRAVADIFSRICVDTEWDEDTPRLAHLSPNPDQAPRLNIDLSDNPDIAQTLAVTCCALNIPFRLSGVANLRIKETDRLEALRQELLKASFMLEVERDALVWDGERVPTRSIPSFSTHGDHRMAMALAPLAVFLPGIEIRDAEVVSKSYPDFWSHLAKAGFTIIKSDELPEELRQHFAAQ